MPISSLHFTGLNLFKNQGDLTPSELTVADNLNLNSGVLETRPGYQGQLTTPLGQPFYGSLPYLQSTGATTVLLSGNSKLYSWVKYANTVSEVLNANGNVSFDINSPTFQGCRLGSYAYMVDGSNNFPIRTNLTTNTAEYASGLNPPTGVPVASLTNLTIDSISSNSGWAGDTLATSYAYTDLVIGATTTHLSSALRPFQQYDVGEILPISSGTGFTPGSYTIASVGTGASAGIAIMNASVGTAASTGGHGTLPLKVTTALTGTYLTTGQTDLNSFGSSTSISNGTQIGSSYLANSATIDNLATAAPGATQFPCPTPTQYAALLDVNGVACATWAQFDDAGKGFTTLINGSALNALLLAAPNADRTNAQFFFSSYYYTSDTRGLQQVAVTVSVYSDVAGASFLTSKTQVFTLPFNGQVPGQLIQHIFDFPGLSTNIGSVVLKVCGAPNNVNAAQFSNYAGFVYVAGLNFKPIGNGLTLTGTFPGIEVQHSEPTAAYEGAFGAVRITKDYGSGSLQNWSAYENIFLPLNGSPGSLGIESLVAAGLSLVCGFRQAGATTHNYTDAVSFPTDFSGIAVNISTVPAAVIASFEYFEIVFTSDLAVASSTANLFIIDGIVGAGNLAISGVASGAAYAPYYYPYTEISDVDNAAYVPQLVNIIESDPSGISNSIAPSTEDAIGQVVLPAPVNAATDWMTVYRGGGITSTAIGYPLKIATVPLFADIGPIWAYTDLVIDGTNNYQVTSAARPFSSSDVNLLIGISGGTGFTAQIGYIHSVSGVKATICTPSGSQANLGTPGSTGGAGNIGDFQDTDNNNPYITWNHTTRTLIDNTPEIFVQNAPLLQYGREQLPKGAQCICAWQNRLMIAVGSTLFASWNVVADAEAGAYTTTIDSANDPSLSIKGAQFGVGAADNDVIVALVPIGSYLFILKNYSIWILTGYDPTSYTLTQFMQYGGSGAMAPRAVVASASDGPAYTPLGIAFNHVVFLGADGLYSFDGSSAKPASLPLHTVLNVKDTQGNILIPASLFSNIAIVFHNHRLLIFAPEVYYYTDLAIDPVTTTNVTSALRPFTSADVGATVNITGGSGFTVSNQNGALPTIGSVTGNVATLSTAAGIAGSTGGTANFAAAKNTITWVFDTYMGGFTRYLVSGTSGCSLSAGTDTNDAIICDYTGQIYLLTGTGDKATPTSTLAAIPISATTGGFGQGSGQGTGDQGFYAKSRPTRLWMSTISPNNSTTYTCRVAGTNAPSIYSTTYTPLQGEDTWTAKVSPSAQGPSVTVNVQASAVGKITIRSIGLDFSKGSIQG